MRALVITEDNITTLITPTVTYFFRDGKATGEIKPINYEDSIREQLDIIKDIALKESPHVHTYSIQVYGDIKKVLSQ